MKTNGSKVGLGWLGVTMVLLATGTSYGASNQDNMRALYETGTEAAKACDFPKVDYNTGAALETSARSCVIIGTGDAPFYFDIARAVRVIPDAGPLVPGRTEEKLVFGDIHLSFDMMEAPKTVDIDLVLDNPIYRTWMDGSNGSIHFVPAQLTARKSGAYLAFRLFIPHDVPGFIDEEYFGYCFGPNSAPLL